MSYTITPSEDGRYITHKVKGEINRHIALPQILEANVLGRELGINRYLVDVTEARNTDSITESYDFAYTDMMKTEGIDRNSRIAILVSPEDASHDFIETVVRNAGLDVKMFTNPEQAKSFLTGK